MLDKANHPVVFLVGMSLGVAAVWAILRMIFTRLGLTNIAALFGGAVVKPA